MANAFLLQAIANLCSIFLGLILPRWLPEETLSQYLLANTVLQTGILLAVLGTKQTLERSYGPWLRSSDERAGGFFAALLAGRAATTLLGAAIVLALATSFRASGLPQVVFPLLIALVLVRSIGELPFHLKLSLGERTAGAWPQSVRFALRVPAVLLGFRLDGLRGIFLAALVVELGLAISGWVRARKSVRWKWQGLSPEGMKREWRFTGDIATYSILVICLNGLGPWVAAWLRLPPKEIIDFTMSWQLALQFLQLHYVAQQAAVPVLAHTLEKGEPASFQDGVDTQARATWIVVSTVTGFAALLAKPLVLWAYGPERAGLVFPLTVCFAAVSAWAMMSVFLHALFAAHQARPTAAIHAAMLGLTAAGFALFAPKFGVDSLSLVYAVVCLAGWLAGLLVYKKHLSCPLALPTLIRIALSLGYGLVGYGTARFFPPAAGLIIFLLIHGLGVAIAGLLKNARGTALVSSLRTA